MNEPLRRAHQGGTSYLVGGDGPPVVFLHGIPGSAHTWEEVAVRMQEQCRVIVPDLRGFGCSDPPEGDYYMGGQARAIYDLLSALNIENVSLVAHDFGGPVALTLMRRFPRLQVKKLVLSSTNAFTDTYVPPPLRLARIPLVSTAFFWLVAGNRWGLWMLYRNATVQRETVSWRQFRRHLTPSAMALTRRIFQRSLADLEANYREVEQMLPEIQIAALVLWGDCDPFFSRRVGERTQAALPNGRLVVFEQTGHFVPEERPSEVAAKLTGFLTG